ncbi:DUF389 domain-containing protein [soil metagenome]
MADVLHVQVIVPSRRRHETLELVEPHPATSHVVLMADAARQPVGDVIAFDVAREASNEILTMLEALDLGDQGAIVVSHTELVISAQAEQAQARAPGDPADSVIWDEVEVTLDEAAAISPPYLAFFVVAAIIGAAGVLTDSPVLIVGAMVVGPEYAPVAACAFGLHRHNGHLVRRGAWCFVVGATIAVGTATVVAVLVRATGQVPDPYSSGEMVMTDFIAHPDALSAAVAAAAAVAGMLALAQGRAGPLVGVLISVTTLPAIAAIGVGVAFTDRSEIIGAAGQLGVNLACLAGFGVGTLAVLGRLSPDPSPRRFPSPRLGSFR